MHDLKRVTDEVEKVFGDVPIYAVGGCVRDTLLGRQPKDFDYCTPADPDEIEALIKAAGRKAYGIGKKFGTLGFKVAIEGQVSDSNVDGELVVTTKTQYEYVEVTTFRKEAYEPNNRKPRVEFVTDLIQDLSRRDFTINAIAYHKGEYIDPFGGRIDLLAKKIKAVGNSADRFKEDPLRMLRAARFASQLGFEVDPNMIGVARKLSAKILTVSRERWVQELDKLLTTSTASTGMAVLKQMGLIQFILPEFLGFINNSLQEEYNELLSELDIEGVDMAWALLLSRIGEPLVERKYNRNGFYVYPGSRPIAREMAVGICARLKFSNDRTKYIMEYLSIGS